MPSSPDLLDRLWAEVIDVDPAGKWIPKSIQRAARFSKYAACASALERLSRSAHVEDLVRISRLMRFEACSVALYSLEDPRLPKAPLTEVIAGFEAIADGKAPLRAVAKYVRSFDLETEDGLAEWVLDLAKDKGSEKPFGDAGPAVARLLEAGVSTEDLSRLARWCEFESTVQTHEILQKANCDLTDLEGIHELLLGSEPSGFEARPGSWPPGKKNVGQAMIAPLWKVRSGQAIAFSRDGERVAIAGASGPARIFASQSGEEVVVCEGIKAHISDLAFSADDSRIAVSQMYHRIAVCDAQTGKLLAKNFFPKPGGDPYGPQISGLAFSNDDKLIRASWNQTIDVADAKTFKAIESLRPAASARSVDAIAFSRDGKKLAAVWDPRKHYSDVTKRVNVWSWPERETLLRFAFPGGLLNGIALSPDGKYIATTYNRYDLKADASLKGIYLFDASTGEMLREWKGAEGRSLAFLPDNHLLATDDSRIWIIDVDGDQPVKKIQVCAPSSSLLGLEVSACNRFLGTVGSSGGAIWDLPKFVL